MFYNCYVNVVSQELSFDSPLQVWINSGDIILLGLRDYQDTKADVILKYTPDEARNLKTYGELPESSKSSCIDLSRILLITCNLLNVC